MPNKQVIVRGRVLGVGFRYYVLQLALQNAVDGQVWNRFDGAVELVASHPDHEILDRFIKGLEDGPGAVRSVSVVDHFQTVVPGFTISTSR